MTRPKAALTYCEIRTKGDVRTVAPRESSADELADFLVGTEVDGRYVIRYELGKGGMGCVFLAYDKTLTRDVALKVQLRTSGGEQEDDAVREARFAAIVEHDGIANVFDHGVHAGKPFTIFEYVQGEDLRTVMLADPIWSVEAVRRLLTQLADALDAAHTVGVIHSDLKPENICLTPFGTPKILDFGIARDLTVDVANATFRGTPAYASPEQAGCRPADARSDQYALGLIVYELLAGARPFEDDDPLMQLHLHEFQQPPELAVLNDAIPTKVSQVVMRALEKKPEDRFATCREFASAFANASQDRRDPERPIHTDIHISETSSESLVARRLANELELNGYTSWYYQRNALPGIPLSRQVHDSLHSARAALLLISRSSLASGDFAEEVLSAHRLKRPCLPILVDISLEEFQSYQPVWRSALGTAAVVELRRDNMKETLGRVESAMKQLGISPSKSPMPKPSSGRVALTQVWATDANQIEINELDRIVFRNEVVNEFLTRRNKYFISATKGLGKTLLLTFKRQLLTQRDSESEESICWIPKGRPYLDFMSEMKLLSARYERPLSDLSTCKRIWGAALRISILSHHGALMSPDLLFELEPFPQRVQRWLKGANVEPTVVFKELTNLAISDVNRLIDGTENFLDEQIRRVHGSTLVFIDKVDQAVRRMSRDAWINIQAGLIEAAWDLMNANGHIKVYASIRQEAFANYESDIKSNMLGATTALRYSDKDLSKLIDRLAGCYEGVDGFKDFVGVNVIKHARRPFPEDSFSFLRRYTFGRPRDFVAISSELSSSLSSLDERQYCDIVRKTSAMGLVANVFDEMMVFLDCLHKKTTRLDFLAQLPFNIVTRAEAVSMSASFNGLPEDSFWHFDEESPDIFHPFRDLFLTGLLGVVKRNEEDREQQRFRQPDDVLSETMRDLPESSHYFIHPALSEYILQHRPSANYRITQHVLVGENAAWHDFDSVIRQIEMELEKVEDANLRNAVHRLLSSAKTILLSSQPGNLRVEMESSTAWLSIRDKLLDAGRDEVILWIEELIG